MPHFFIDENHRALVHPSAIRPKFGAAAIATVALGAATTSTTLPAGIVRNAQGEALIMLVTDSQGALVAFDAAGAAASYTGTANMVMVPPNTWRAVPVRGTDTTLYAQQLGAGGNLQAVALD